VQEKGTGPRGVPLAELVPARTCAAPYKARALTPGSSADPIWRPRPQSTRSGSDPCQSGPSRSRGRGSAETRVNVGARDVGGSRGSAPHDTYLDSRRSHATPAADESEQSTRREVRLPAAAPSASHRCQARVPLAAARIQRLVFVAIRGVGGVGERGVRAGACAAIDLRLRARGLGGLSSDRSARARYRKDSN